LIHSPEFSTLFLSHELGIKNKAIPLRVNQWISQQEARGRIGKSYIATFPSAVLLCLLFLIKLLIKKIKLDLALVTAASLCFSGKVVTVRHYYH
jgi:hypothetical protein